MSYEAALQRIGELRTFSGNSSTGSATGAAAATPGAFGAALSQHQDMLAAASADGTLTLSEGGLPILTVADQYKLLGKPMPASLGGGISAINAGGTGVGQRMVALAQKEIGQSETGGNNDSARIKEYRAATAGAENTPGPWCAYFVSWLGQQSGAPVGANGNGTGYVPTLEAWGKQEGRYTPHGQGTPNPGDIVIINWNGAGVADHTGIVESVDPDGTVHTIEGNSSDSVKRREYGPGTNDIQGYVRVG